MNLRIRFRILTPLKLGIKAECNIVTEPALRIRKVLMLIWLWLSNLIWIRSESTQSRSLVMQKHKYGFSFSNLIAKFDPETKKNALIIKVNEPPSTVVLKYHFDDFLSRQ
jgi:hypothetical protein